MFSSVHFSMTSDWQTVPFNQYFAAIVLSGVYGLFILASWHKFCVVLFMSSCTALSISFICYREGT